MCHHAQPSVSFLTASAYVTLDLADAQGGAWLTLHSLQREPAHYLGYVYFRQVKDSSVKRGYFQKVS